MTLAAGQIKDLLRTVFPQHSVSNLEVLSGGLINTNFKVSFVSREPVVLRVYRDGADVCSKEIAIHSLVSDTIPVPKILYSDLSPVAFSVIEFVHAITFQELKRSGDLKAIQQAAASVGKTLAEIGRFQFAKPGRLLVKDGHLMVGEPYVEGPNAIPELIEQFLSSTVCLARLGQRMAERILKFTIEWSRFLPNMDEHSSLVHSDFGNRNILVHEKGGQWEVAAVLDWEFAFSGSPLLDVGHFLRYERLDQPLREPHFSTAFVENGGFLPHNWREISRVIDLTALVQCLTLENLPKDVEDELIELITATIGQCSLRMSTE